MRAVLLGGVLGIALVGIAAGVWALLADLGGGEQERPEFVLDAGSPLEIADLTSLLPADHRETGRVVAGDAVAVVYLDGESFQLTASLIVRDTEGLRHVEEALLSCGYDERIPDPGPAPTFLVDDGVVYVGCRWVLGRFFDGPGDSYVHTLWVVEPGEDRLIVHPSSTRSFTAVSVEGEETPLPPVHVGWSTVNWSTVPTGEGRPEIALRWCQEDDCTEQSEVLADISVTTVHLVFDEAAGIYRAVACTPEDGLRRELPAPGIDATDDPEALFPAVAETCPGVVP